MGLQKIPEWAFVLRNFNRSGRLTVPRAVVIVEGVLWPFQDCRKIRPLVSESSE